LFSGERRGYGGGGGSDSYGRDRRGGEHLQQLFFDIPRKFFPKKCRGKFSIFRRKNFKKSFPQEIQRKIPRKNRSRVSMF
jgi:hypothetical protein